MSAHAHSAGPTHAAHRITHVVLGSAGPFDARACHTDGPAIRRDGAGVPRYDRLPRSVIHALDEVVRRTPDAEAIVDAGGTRLSYGELWARSTAVAGGLRGAGVRPGDRVAVDQPSGSAWVVAVLGALMAGAFAVPINTRLSAAERHEVLAGTDCKVVLDGETPTPTGAPYVYWDTDAHAVAAIFSTSGTTGSSKGAISTHEALLAVAENLRRATGIGPRAGAALRSLVCVPLFHVTGFAAQMLPTLLSGGTLVIVRGLDARQILSTIETERITQLVAVPAIYYYLLSSPGFRPALLAGVRWALYGGAPIAPDLVRELKQAMPGARVANGYGMSETSSLATMLPHEDSEQHAASVGYPCPCIDVGLLDADASTGVGEVVLRGQTVTAGYWNRPAETEDAFIDGWLRTGDIGRLDDAGRLYLIDRAKDMINRGGENVFSVEVENALAGAPGVGEVAVVGVPDAMMGEKVGCVVVPAGPDFDVSALLRHAAAQIADYKVPQYVAIADEPLPRNAAGKVLKNVLRERTTWGRPVR
jgi:long-chain acyl-CoA synthetase